MGKGRGKGRGIKGVISSLFEKKDKKGSRDKGKEQDNNGLPRDRSESSVNDSTSSPTPRERPAEPPANDVPVPTTTITPAPSTTSITTLPPQTTTSPSLTPTSPSATARTSPTDNASNDHAANSNAVTNDSAASHVPPSNTSPRDVNNNDDNGESSRSPRKTPATRSRKPSFAASTDHLTESNESMEPARRDRRSGVFVPLPFKEREIAREASDSPNPKQRASGPPEILPEEIEKTEFIGQGSFGSVYKGMCRGQEVAVKVPKKQKLSVNELTSFRTEVKTMSKIFHPNVVLFLGACTQLGKMQIVTELCMMDMEKLLAADREKKQHSLFRRMQMAKDAALGMNWLHYISRIVHLDLKSANLLVDNNLRVKVTDFGFSQIKEDTPIADKAKKGTPLWMAPEVMMGMPYDFKADIYSFGIILWEILTRDVPYAHHTDYTTFFKAVCIDKERPPIPPDTLRSLTHLITSCWDFDPKNRPTFSEIVFRLNEVLVDCAIDNEYGRDLWKTHFLLPKQELNEQVPWADFEAVLRQSLGKNIDLEYLRALIATAPRDQTIKCQQVVTMERFDKVIKWLGVFFDEETGTDSIQELNELMTKSWLHGDITKEEAMERLARQEEGTFLIRFSSTDPKAAPFTVSMTGNEHRRIRRLNPDEDGRTGYKILGKSTIYSTLTELTETCKDYNLRKPCPKKGNDNPYGDICY